MQRRGFLASILATGMAPAFVGAKVLMPVRALVLPEPVDLIFPFKPYDGGLLTISMITREALRSLERNLAFAEGTNWAYESSPRAIFALDDMMSRWAAQ